VQHGRDKQGIIVVKPEKKQMFGETQVRVFELDYAEAVDVVKIVPKMLSSVGTLMSATGASPMPAARTGRTW